RDAPLDCAGARADHQRHLRVGGPRGAGALPRTARLRRGSEHGIRTADAVLLMRLAQTLATASPALTGGAMLHAAMAQAVERTDVPARGILRVTFDPRIMTWNDEFTDAGRRRLGFGLTGDTIGSRYIPVLGQLEQNVRTVTGDLIPVIRPQLLGHGARVALLPRFVASLGAGLLSVRQERRTYPITPELGVTC